MVSESSFATAAILLICSATIAVAQESVSLSKLESTELGSTRNVHSFGHNLLCGQPSAEEFAEAKRRGIKIVITLRGDDEIDWDEAATVKQLGLEFHQLGFRAPETLTNEILEESLALLAESNMTPVMLHCASANRVGAIWLAHRVLNDGVSYENASKEAKIVGLRTAGYEEVIRKYIKMRSADRN